MSELSGSEIDSKGLIRIICFITFSLTLFSCSDNTFSEKNYSDEKFYGAYQYKSGETLYEALELNSDHVFNSWLHERPSASGAWSLKDEAIFIFDAMKISAVFDKVE